MEGTFFDGLVVVISLALILVVVLIVAKLRSEIKYDSKTRNRPEYSLNYSNENEARVVCQEINQQLEPYRRTSTDLARYKAHFNPFKDAQYVVFIRPSTRQVCHQIFFDNF